MDAAAAAPRSAAGLGGGAAPPGGAAAEAAAPGGAAAADEEEDQYPPGWQPGDGPPESGDSSSCEEGEECEEEEADGSEGEAEEEAGADAGELFAERELRGWTPAQALLWIGGAGSPFEVLGLRPRPFGDRAGLKARYRRLSLLAHPDKNDSPEAASCFQRLHKAFQVLSDEREQLQLLHTLFPAEYEDPALGGAGKRDLKKAAKAARRARRAARRAQSDGAAILTVDQAKAAARELAKLQAAEKSARLRFANRRVMDQFAAAKRPRKEREQLVPGLAGAAREGPEKPPRGSGARVAAAGDWRPRWHGAAAAPPAPAAAAASGAAWGPRDLWAVGGAAALAAAGWRRLESRGRPGVFYFAHEGTGRAVLEVPEAEEVRPPAAVASPAPEGSPHDGWERRESRSQPGVFYRVCPRTGAASLERPRPPPPAETSAVGAGREAGGDGAAPPGGERAPAAPPAAGAP